MTYHGGMWWIAFTALDLYIGLVILDLLAPNLAAEKQSQIKQARKIVMGSIGVAVAAFLYVWLRR